MIKRYSITIVLFLLAVALQALGVTAIAVTGFVLWVTFCQGKPVPIVEVLCFAVAGDLVRHAWKIAQEETDALLADDN